MDANGNYIRRYLWGSDLSGSMQGAGGVGGLLAVRDTSGAHVVAYDGNGNVAALFGQSGESARYEYGPFGEVIRTTGTMGKNNPFRFSTKYQDDETDLLYYGYRYYSASTGRWLSRDPLEELGGLNLYGFVQNGGPNGIDVDGRIGPVGALIGAGIEIGMQVSFNLMRGDNWYDIDVKDVLISAAVGAVAPGWFSAAKKSKALWEGNKAFKLAIKRVVKTRGRRVVGTDPESMAELAKLTQRVAKKVAEHNKVVKDTIQTVGVQLAWQAGKQISKAVADDVEETLKKLKCPPEYSASVSQTDSVPFVFEVGNINQPPDIEFPPIVIEEN